MVCVLPEHECVSVPVSMLFVEIFQEIFVSKQSQSEQDSQTAGFPHAQKYSSMLLIKHSCFRGACISGDKFVKSNAKS